MFAVSVTVCDVGTEAMVAVNCTAVELAGTVTLDGTVTAAPLLARLTTVPLADNEPILTVQMSVAAPSAVAVEQ